MRFLHASAMAGRLHLLDVGDFGSWQPDRIAYWDEDTLDSLADRMIFRKARTVEELDAALESSRWKPGDPMPLGSVTVWVSEDLLDALDDNIFGKVKNQYSSYPRTRDDPLAAPSASATLGRRSDATSR